MASWTSRETRARDRSVGCRDAPLAAAPRRRAALEAPAPAPDLLRHAPLRRPLRFLLLAGGRRRREAKSSRPQRSRRSPPPSGRCSGSPIPAASRRCARISRRSPAPSPGTAAPSSSCSRPTGSTRNVPPRRRRGSSTRRRAARSSSSSRWTARRRSTTGCAASPGRTRASSRASGCCGSWRSANRGSRSASTPCSARRTRGSPTRSSPRSRASTGWTPTRSVSFAARSPTPRSAPSTRRATSPPPRRSPPSCAGSQPRYRFCGARLKAAQDVLQRRIIAETLRRQGRVIPCHAGRLNLVLDECGGLYPCEEFSLRLGNVRDHGLDVRATARHPGRRRPRFHRPRRVLVHARVLHDDQHPLQPAPLPALLAEYLRLPRQEPLLTGFSLAAATQRQHRKSTTNPILSCMLSRRLHDYFKMSSIIMVLSRRLTEKVKYS